MNDLQDKIVHFAIIFTGIVLYGLLMGLVKGQYSIDFESILDVLKPFISPIYTYDFFIEVMSRDYFINDHLILDKTYISLAVVIAFYSPILSFFIIVANLLKFDVEKLMLGYLFIPMGISIAFLWTLIVCSVIFSIAPTLIKGFFNG